MTCIVAKVVDGVVHMAGDRMATDGHNGVKYNRPKVFHNNEFIVGYTDSFRLGQLLEFSWNPPAQHHDADLGHFDESLDNFIYVRVLDSIKKLIDDGECKVGSTELFMFGYKDKIYTIQGDMSIFEHSNYTAVGCGMYEAMASLYTFSAVRAMGTNVEVDIQLETAIIAASKTKVGVNDTIDFFVNK